MLPNDITLCVGHRGCPSSPPSTSSVLGIESENTNHVFSPANLTQVNAVDGRNPTGERKQQPYPPPRPLRSLDVLLLGKKEKGKVSTRNIKAKGLVWV